MNHIEISNHPNLQNAFLKPSLLLPPPLHSLVPPIPQPPAHAALHQSQRLVDAVSVPERLQYRCPAGGRRKRQASFRRRKSFGREINLFGDIRIGLSDAEVRKSAYEETVPLDFAQRGLFYCRVVYWTLHRTWFLFVFIAVAVDRAGACGALVNADPLNACSPLRNGRQANETDRARFALIVRGESAFKDKVRNAQNAGFGAAIVYDDRDGEDLVYSELLKDHAYDEEGECCIFPFQTETAWTVLAISFISFIVILGILLIAIFAPRHWLYSQGRNQLPKSVDRKVVEALPCFTFSSARLGECHSEETCAICL